VLAVHCHSPASEEEHCGSAFLAQMISALIALYWFQNSLRKKKSYLPMEWWCLDLRFFSSSRGWSLITRKVAGPLISESIRQNTKAGN